MVAAMWNPDQYLRFGDERGRPFGDLLARVHAVDPGYVVDLGCGPGHLTALLAERWPRAQVLGVDNSPEMIAAANAAAGAPASAAAGTTASAAASAPAGAAASAAAGAPAGVAAGTTASAAASAPAGVAAGTTASAAAGAPASAAAGARLSFALADIRDWRPDRRVDVLVSNAVLQWVPDHLDLLTRWVGLLAPGGWLAAQLPGNFDQPSHTILRGLAASSRWRPLLGDVSLNRQAGDPAAYLDVLARAGCQVDAWETTYLHVLHGEDPVVEWYKGTGLRPVLAALPPGRSEEFLTEYAARVRDAYPAAPYGTVLPFRRVFVVATRR
jgi:trans-aconitate 2-methyltransferase